ncbi:DNA mismatch repair endonuclease MutL [Defluviitalea raffinosedens]|uniref:DNA mismatch repair protein MutL n=1 Tax=Defluviitalea raffinosedens TaxID=1450156 RepID=A0A7C8HGC9_9FIRM|nr:DNA mismatch repair endonuclease MutL [Defluviitalea raffinosedens]KAE9637107.1 DNA mismatch repair endonuclease MutL [Defluviitalea raffinosedens]HHW66870.1 DNA mismatch repair endonuclease MutL [Candidatus Epulonipiscium sp.]
MNPIHKLDEHTINQIAAGEVVERPASVVKELIENSIDARASAITVEIKDGGISLIRITDNGVGIPKDQVTTAFLRHTTSKIYKVEDLNHIDSLGFRGEALASIAAVSQLEMITKVVGDVTGKRVEIHGGQLKAEQEIGCPEGTTLIVKNLFYNVPARKKFLKKPSTEGSYISDIVYKTALGHPEVSFKYINNNSIVFHTSGNNDLRNAVFNVYGKEVIKKMISIEEENNNLKITGLIGKPEVNRANRSYENFYINGRYIKSKILESAVEEAYKTLLPINKFPVVVLHIYIDPNKIDVNVHPTKMEVRFRDEEEIYYFVVESIRKNLKQEDLIPKVTWETPKKEKLFQTEVIQGKLPEPFEIKRNISFSEETIKQEPPKDFTKDTLGDIKESNDGYTPKAPSHSDEILKVKEDISAISINNEKEALSEPKSIPKHYTIIGQVFKTYWIVEQEGMMYVVDQHAAHERILYEKFMNSFKSGNIHSQTLLQPLVINVSPKEKEVIEDNRQLFADFGFEIEEFGDLSYVIRALPMLFDGPVDSGFFLDIVDAFLNDEHIQNAYDMKLNTIATFSCKSAVKAKDKLSYAESRALIEELFTLENPYTCPHGRPTIISMSQYELEKKFKRVQ